MTPEKIQELREWSARKMGWELYNGTFWGQANYARIRVENWQPDRPESGQIWMLVERMRELGWDFQLNNYADDNEGFQARFLNYELPDFTFGIKSLKVEKEEDLKLIKSLSEACKPWKTDPNPCLAVLLAAKATED